MKTVLIAEDDKLTAKIYSDLLTRAGYTAEVVVDGPAALRRVQSSMPDALLLDVMLPGMNGIEVLRAIRALTPDHKVPAIIITNADIPRFRQEAAGAGATTFLSKSQVSAGELVKVLQPVEAGGKPHSERPITKSYLPIG